MLLIHTASLMQTSTCCPPMAPSAYHPSIHASIHPIIYLSIYTIHLLGSATYESIIYLPVVSIHPSLHLTYHLPIVLQSIFVNKNPKDSEVKLGLVILINAKLLLNSMSVSCSWLICCSQLGQVLLQDNWQCLDGSQGYWPTSDSFYHKITWPQVATVPRGKAPAEDC